MKIAECSGKGCRVKEVCRRYIEYMNADQYKESTSFIIPKEDCDNFINITKKQNENRD